MTNSKKTILLLVGIGIILALLSLILMRVMYIKTALENTQQNPDTTFEDSQYHDYTQDLYYENSPAVREEIKSKLASMDSSENETLNLQLAYANAVLTDRTATDKTEAVDMLFAVAQDTKNPSRIRATALNMLIWFGSYTFWDEAWDSDAYFSKLADAFVVPSTNEVFDARYAMLELASSSYAIYPLPFSALTQANWYSNALLGGPESGYVSSLSEEETVQAINEFINKFDQAHQAEKNSIYYSLQESENIDNLLWKGRILGDTALAGFAPEQSFETAFTEILNETDSESVGTNAIYPNYLPIVHFYYAAYLQKLDPESRQEDIQKHVDELVAIVNSEEGNASVLGDFDGLVLQARDSELVISELMRMIADISPEFKVYLIGKGWSF